MKWKLSNARDLMKQFKAQDPQSYWKQVHLGRRSQSFVLLFFHLLSRTYFCAFVCLKWSCVIIFFVYLFLTGSRACHGHSVFATFGRGIGYRPEQGWAQIHRRRVPGCSGENSIFFTSLITTSFIVKIKYNHQQCVTRSTGINIM